MENDITKDLAKRRCYHCQEKGHYVNSCPQKNPQLRHGGSQSQINIGLPPSSNSDTQYKGSHDEIDVVNDVSLPCKRCYPDAPAIMSSLRIRSLCPYVMKTLVPKSSQVNSLYVWLVNL